MSEDSSSSNLQVEEATDSGKLIGWRLRVLPSGQGSDYDTLLVFADVPGFRHGPGFVPRFGGTVEYREVFSGRQHVETSG